MHRQQDIEEVLSIIWEMAEREELTLGKVKETVAKVVNPAILENLAGDNLITISGEKINFSEKGRELAKDIIRRQRLAERLLYDVLEVPPGESDMQACAFEHIISREVEKSICTLLGHPKQCPHGSPIPPGECCKQAPDTIASIVQSLDKFKPGEQGKIIYIVMKDHPQIHKLMSLGIIPGTIIKVHQTFPSYVIQVAETQLA
ncbi:MAG: metal-dependent transcriptional regulator, partial [bacterium]